MKNKLMNENELRLYGPITAFSWYDDEDIITARAVENALKDFEGDTLKVRINSPGGDVFESVAIANTLRNLDAKVEIIIDGLAASGGSIIAMAGDTVKMYDNSTLMIHNAWTTAVGNADEFRKMADDLDVIDNSVMNTYKSRFKGSDEELKELLSNETFMTAETALEYGLADEIVGLEKEKVSNSINDNPEKIVKNRVNEENQTFNNLKQLLLNYK